MELEILIPQSIEEQAAIVLGAKRAYQQAIIEREGLEEVIEELKNNYKDELSIKRHNLKQFILGASVSTTLLEKFFEGKEYKSDIVYADKNIIQVLIGIKKSLNDLSSGLKDLTIDHHPEELEKVNLNNLLSTFSFRNYPINYIVDFESFNVEEIEEEDASMVENTSYKTEAFVKISKNEFNKVLINIFDNAITHGMNHQNKSDFSFRIYLRYIALEDIFMVEIWNNGHPFSKGISIENYIKKGISIGENSGQGLGGYFINETVKNFKGKIEIQKDLDNEYQVGIIIKLPKYHDYE